MQFLSLKMNRVKVYGTDGRVIASFKVAAESTTVAEQKVTEYADSVGLQYSNVKAFHAGRVDFFS